MSVATARAISTAAAAAAVCRPRPAKHNEPLIAHTDGSCIFQHDPKRRMAGVGVFFGTGHADNLSEPLLGDQQDSPRAELQGAVRALERARRYPYRPLTINCDCYYVVLEGRRALGLERPIKGTRPNNDLLDRLARLVTTRQARVEFKHVKGHSTDFGNNAANDLAQKAARAAFDRHEKATAAAAIAESAAAARQ